MADLTQLARGLENYLTELDRHSNKVQAEHAALVRSLQRLSAVYEGVAARDFKAHWQNTQHRLDEYTDGTRAIRGMLQVRVDALRAADRPGAL